ncbi:MAG: phosphotransferase [Bacteroidota bacterium]
MQSEVFFQFDEPEALIQFLNENGWIATDETVEEISKAGEGNMNFVARIRTSKRSVIFKQSRPWVEKYPQIAAPVERIESEITFYEAVKPYPVIAGGMPALLAIAPASRCALFEDLGKVEDYTNMYSGDLAPATEIRQLISWLGTLHNASFDPTLRSSLANKAMRQLNHAHLFDIPLQPENGLALDDITSGLQAQATKLQKNEAFIRQIEQLGKLYMEDGTTLLHGDFYPGSWVRTVTGPKVIDPEFGFFGPASYDVGVCMAHLLIAGFGATEIKHLMEAYKAPAEFDKLLACQFAGMEIMRRLIGVAQLPVDKTLATKVELLDQATQLVLAPQNYNWID